MDLGQQIEWLEFTKYAVEIVRKGNIQNKHRLTRVFQIILCPTFDNVIGWEVCKKTSHEPEAFLAICTKWNLLKDIEKFASPVEKLKYLNCLAPSIENYEFELDSTFAKSILNKFKSISVRAFIESEHSGLDGTSYEVNIGNTWANLQFHWWESPPKAWQQLGEITFEALEKLNRLLAQSE